MKYYKNPNISQKIDFYSCMNLYVLLHGDFEGNIHATYIRRNSHLCEADASAEQHKSRSV